MANSTPEETRPFRPDVALGPLRFAFTEKKLVVCRGDWGRFPHVTLSWCNASGEIDLHITRGKEVYEPLLRVPAGKLEQWAERFGLVVTRHLQRLQSYYKRYQPGWLGRKGYIVALHRPADVEQWWLDTVPRVRGKYRVDVERLARFRDFPDPIDGTFYRANILAHIDPDEVAQPVVAVRVNRKTGGMSDSIQLMNRPGEGARAGWWGWKPRQLEQVFPRLHDELMATLRRIVPARAHTVMERISEALDLPGALAIIEEAGRDARKGAAIDAAGRRSDRPR